MRRCPDRRYLPATLFEEEKTLPPCQGEVVTTGEGPDQTSTCRRCAATWSWDSKEEP